MQNDDERPALGRQLSGKAASAERKRDREAMRWAQVVQNPAFDRWDAFTRWLESHPGNLARYELWIKFQGGKPIALDIPEP